MVKYQTHWPAHANVEEGGRDPCIGRLALPNRGLMPRHGLLSSRSWLLGQTLLLLPRTQMHFFAPLSTLCHSCHFPVLSWAKAFFVVWPCILYSVQQLSLFHRWLQFSEEILHPAPSDCAFWEITLRSLLHCVTLCYIAMSVTLCYITLHCDCAFWEFTLLLLYLCPNQSSECCKGSCANLEVQGRD